MEFTAAIEGLRALPAGQPRVHRHRLAADARLDDEVDRGLEAPGLEDRRRGPVKNEDLVRALEAELARHEAVRWHWVRGHETGDAHAHKALNDRADRLAVAASHAAA